jgi:hypothetical protein
MKYMEKIWRQLISKIFIPQKTVPDLLTMVEECRNAWRNAISEFNNCDTELIDYMIFRLNATERRYMALLSQARREGLKAWPDYLAEPCIMKTQADNGCSCCE